MNVYVTIKIHVYMNVYVIYLHTAIGCYSYIRPMILAPPRSDPDNGILIRYGEG